MKIQVTLTWGDNSVTRILDLYELRDFVASEVAKHDYQPPTDVHIKT